MPLLRSNAFALLVFGGIILSLGIFGTADYYITQALYPVPQNMGIILGNTGISLLGLVTIATAQSLRKIESRLDKLERVDCP